mmetsp:Transcript_18581/g.21383  ORF Transcript_18581/g.21383 Transcript_18581/m.21383 type:complete len:454 (-) Transcript_18581:45-1406(-)
MHRQRKLFLSQSLVPGVMKHSLAPIALVAFFAFMSLFINRGELSLNKNLRSLIVDTTEAKEEVCLTFPKLHDLRVDCTDDYNEKLKTMIREVGVYDRDMPKIKVLGNGARFAIWGPYYPSQASAWIEIDGEFQVVDGPGWVAPRDEIIHPRIFFHKGKGSYVGISSIFTNNYGHLVHDNLPIIAWLLTVVPPTTKFILHFDPAYPIFRDLLIAIDPEFVSKRVVLIPYNHVFVVAEGELMVMIPDRHPTYMETSFMHPLQNWLSNGRPRSLIDSSNVDNSEGLIIYYSRGGVTNEDHGRVVELNHEREIIWRIEQAMVRHNRKEELYIFNGMDYGKPMSILLQSHIFHKATTIIGPHGSGLANMIWLDLDRAGSTCAQRPKVLEFIAGSDPALVKNGVTAGPFVGYHILFRGLPIDFHNILYTSNSTSAATFINLEALDLALDDMWGLSSDTN